MALLASMSFVFFHAYIETCQSIVGGESVSASQYPFIAYVNNRHTNATVDSWCGGTILRKESPAVILTAAQCVVRALMDNFAYVVLHGDIRNDSNGIKKPISSIQIHPNFDYWYYDIALLFIDEGLDQYTQLTTVDIVPLSSDSSECCNTGDDLTVIGYGRDYEGGPLTPTLESVDINYMSRSECDNDDYLRLQPDITNSVICAYTPNKDACHSDDGGPLLIKGSNQQIGIISYKVGCAREWPGVYTNIGMPEIYDWIQAEIMYETTTKEPTKRPTNKPTPCMITCINPPCPPCVPSFPF